MSIRLDVVQIFADNRKREDQVRALVEYIEGFVTLPPGSEVTPLETRIETHAVEAYGLVLGIDANGDACRVTFPYGALVD